MEIIFEELNQFNKALKEKLSLQDNQISDKICEFVFAKSKLLRPKLIFLFAKSFDIKPTKEIINLACATELIHDSTLIHDDIIDKCDLRRGIKTLNANFGNNLSVLSGDMLLSVAMDFLSECNNLDVFKIFANSLKLMCEGEINQHFTVNKIPTLDEYIIKSEHKTAELFKASLLSLCKIANIKNEAAILDFAKNFGIAFQIKDDLKNISDADTLKPKFSDIQNGIYTAPVIFLNQKTNIENLSTKEIINLIDSNDFAIQQTKDLIQKYNNLAKNSLSGIPDSESKNQILALL